MVPLHKHSSVGMSSCINVAQMSLRFCLDKVSDLIFLHEHSFSSSPTYNVKQTAMLGGLSQLLGPMSLGMQGNSPSRELTVTEPGKSSSGSFQFCFFLHRH